MADVDEVEALSAAPVVAHAARGEGGVVERDDAEPADVAAVVGCLRADELGADGRMESVGADEEVAVRRAPVREADGGARVVGHGRDPPRHRHGRRLPPRQTQGRKQARDTPCAPLATSDPRVVLKDLADQPVEGPAVGDEMVHLDLQMRDVRTLHQQRGFDQGAAVRERQQRRQRAPDPRGARDVGFGLLREVHPANREAALPRHPLKGRSRPFTEPQLERLVPIQHTFDAPGERIEIDPAPQPFVDDDVELRRLRGLRTGGPNIALVTPSAGFAHAAGSAHGRSPALVSPGGSLQQPRFSSWRGSCRLATGQTP